MFAYWPSGDPAEGTHFDLATDNGDPRAITYADGSSYTSKRNGDCK